MSRRFAVAALVLATLVGRAGAAGADPIVITIISGSVSASDQDPVGFNLHAPSLSLAGGLEWTHLPLVDCSPCSSGTIIDFDALLDGPDELHRGPATISGTTHSEVFYDGRLAFAAGEVLVPPPPGDFYFLTAPFTMTGRIVAFPDSTRSGTPLLDVNVRGAGIATMELLHVPATGDQFAIDISYDFQAAPIPEPATLLLVGAGLGGAVLRRRRSKRAPAPTTDRPPRDIP